MNLSGLQTRLNKLEHGAGDGGALLEFEDGQTLAIAPRDGIGLMIAAMRREYARDEGEPIPASRHDKQLNAFEKALRVTSDDPLIELIHSVVHPPVTQEETNR